MLSPRDLSKAHDSCCMTPSVLLSTSLALATLAPAVLQAGTATADASRVAFAVSTSRGSTLRPQQAHEYLCPAATTSLHSLGLRRRRTSSQLLSSSSWSTDCGARRSSQRYAGATKPAAGPMAMVSRGMRRRLFSVLGAARTSLGAATASEASGDGAAKQQTAWRRGGVDAADSSADRTAPSEVQRARSVREQMVQMLKPELPRVSELDSARF